MCQAMCCNYLNHFLSNKDWYQTHNYIKFYLSLHPIPAIVISVAHDGEIEFFVFQSFFGFVSQSTKLPAIANNVAGHLPTISLGGLYHNNKVCSPMVRL